MKRPGLYLWLLLLNNSEPDPFFFFFFFWLEQVDNLFVINLEKEIPCGTCFGEREISSVFADDFVMDSRLPSGDVK